MLDPTIEEICCGADLEVRQVTVTTRSSRSQLTLPQLDPSRLGPDADLKRNQARFEKLIGRLMNDITSSANQCPMYEELQ